MEKPLKRADLPQMHPLSQLEWEFPNETIRTVTERDGTEKPIFMMGQEHIRRRWLELTGDDVDVGGAFARFRKNSL